MCCAEHLFNIGRWAVIADPQVFDAVLSPAFKTKLLRMRTQALARMFVTPFGFVCVLDQGHEWFG
jgi:hypothetical protein